MAGYIGSRASVVSSGAERKKTFAITTTTTALTGLVYTPTKVHVFHNGVRLVDGTDFTATNSTSITLTVAAESGDQVVVVSYASFQTSDTVSASAGGTFSGDVNFGDNNKAIFGAGSDLQIYHDGSNSYVDDAGTGRLILRGNDRVMIQKYTGEDMISCLADGAVNIYHNNAKKFDTTSTGINVTGKATLTSGELTFSGSISDPNGAAYIWRPADNTLAFGTANEERMRIDSSGNLLVGQSSSTAVGAGNTTTGFSIRGDGGLYASRTEGRTATFNRNTTDGDILGFYKSGSVVGSINITNSSSVVSLTGTNSGGGIAVSKSSANVFPARRNIGVIDNTLDFGSSSYRWDDIYATNGSIQTSDRNEKQDVAALTATEMLVAARISGLFKTFRWIDSVADKGDDARTHTGVIAQDVHASFLAEGLDAGDYALFTSTTWWETQTDVAAVEADEDNEIEAADAYTRTDTFDTLDEAPDGATERTRMGIRYPELLAFVGSYNEQRFASIETRLAALEGN